VDRRTALVALPAALLAGCAPPAPPRPPQIPRGDYAYARAAVEHEARRLLAKQDIPGLALALVDDQAVVLAQGFGLADVVRGVPATADTLYRIGSVSKLFTGLAVVRLAEQGRIDLDAPISAAVPGFSLRSRFGPGLPVTARSLLAHHSGLPRDLLDGMWVEEPVSLARLVEDLRESSLVAPPQTRFRYSNLDFSVLGRAVEVIEGRPFAEAMRDAVLRPLGMGRSTFAMTPAVRAQTARPYRADGSLAPRVELRDAPAGSMLSSASEMALFLRAVFAGGKAGETRVIGEAALASMLTPQYPGLARDFGAEIGLAFALSGMRPRDRRIAWHAGSFPPYHSIVLLLPRERLGVVVLSGSARAAGHIVRLAQQALALMLETKLGVTASPEPAPPPVDAPAQPASLARYAGRYTFSGELTEVTVAGDRLRSSLQGRTVDLLPAGPDRFTIQARALLGLFKVPLPRASVEFTTVEGRAAALLRAGPDVVAVAERADPVPIPAAWRARVGTWARALLHGEGMAITRVELREDRGLLVARAHLAFPLVSDEEGTSLTAIWPLSDDEAVTAGIGDGEGNTVRVLRRGAEEALVVQGFELRRVG
jgi:CubicO group peptidase (beta-lactamase class C family)